MTAVSGARHAFHHLYVEWHGLVGLGPTNDEKKLPCLVTIDIPQDREKWLEELRDVVAGRNRIIHVTEDTRPAVPHPLGTNTSLLDSQFTSERATRVVDLLLDFYRRVIESPSPELSAWASSHVHVVSDFEDYRERVWGDLGVASKRSARRARRRR